MGAFTDDTSGPRTKMIHATHAAVELATMMGAIGFPVVAFVAPLRVSFVITNKGVVLFNSFPAHILLFGIRVSHWSKAWVHPYRLEQPQPSQEKYQEEKSIDGDEGDGSALPRRYAT